MIDQLKDLKDTYENARQMIDRGKEPVEDLLKLVGFLKALIEDPSILSEKLDKDYKRYFYDDFSMGLLKRLTRERSRDDKYLEVIAEILQSYIKIFIQMLKHGQLNLQFFDSVKFLFEYDSILHNYNYQIPEDELKSLRSANQEWRKELKEGDMVDAIIDENNSRCSGWSQARISQVNGDVLHLEFIFDTKTADKFVDRWSVEIALYESKTKETWEWKETLQANQVVDAHDKTVWNKSTILEIKEQNVAPNRIVKMAYIGYRVYVENGTKNDEKGTFDGWSNRFDEWVSVYSPRIQPFFTKTQKGMSDDLDLDEDFDNLVQPKEGQTRVYAVPRLRKCISSLFIDNINLFGNTGGFELIIEVLSQKSKDEESYMDLNILANVIHCVSYPYLIYHKEFIQEYGPKFVEMCQQKLKDAPEKSLRDVRREKIESIIKSIDNFLRRLVPKDEREKKTEILKLEVSLMCLKSSYLERRIQGIRDLNQIIKYNRMFTNKNFTATFLIEWMKDNEVFNILFDTKKTHLQLVQRCTDILKLLLQENMFTQDLMEMFWSLAKSDYKFEIYKIINECSFYLKQEHINFFFEQIKQVPSEKLAIEELQCLSELGKYAKEAEFKEQVTQYFWTIICNSETYKEDLVNNCITKFCEMVKYWDLKAKHEFFVGLTKNLAENKSSIPSLKLFKGLLKDQKDKSSYQSNSSPSKQQSAGDNEQSSTQIEQELNINQSLDMLINDQKLIKILLDNLANYQGQAKYNLKDQPIDNRKKLFLVNAKYSHQDEIDERLQFIKYIAQISPTYQISKVELDILYDLLVINGIIPTDSEEFLTWCKLSCEQSTATSQILDLNEVGEFFTQKMNDGSLDVKNLIVVGFDFLQQYFLSVNETSQKLIKASKPQQKKNAGAMYTSISYGWNSTGFYGPKTPSQYGGKRSVDDDDLKLPTFKLIVEPSKLDQLDIVWNIALKCENPKVIPKAIDFLIKVYYSLDVDLDDKKIQIQDDLIAKCIDLLRNEQDEAQVRRVIEIVKNIIYEAEKKGTGDVQPHNALLKGELLERITIKNKASPKPAMVTMSIYSNTTFWEFKKELAKQLDLAPKYMKVEKMGQSIRDIDNGKTLAELEFQSQDTLTIYKINIEEEVPNAPLITDGKLSEKASQIFNEWYDNYSDDVGQMTKETCALFIKGCTGEYPGVGDERIANLFKIYDGNQDGKIERSEFLYFYESSAKAKPETVRENLRAHNIRNDLKKLSEVQEESSFSREEMPRFKISKNQEYFDLLLGLLDRRGQVSEASWNLIQMLATNQELYTRVLQLQTAMHNGTIEWSQFFDTNSVYKLLYTLQIIEAVMEEGEGEGLERIQVIDENESRNKGKNIPQAPPLPGAERPPSVNEATVLGEEGTSTQSQPIVEELSKQPSVSLISEANLQKRQSTIVKDEEDSKLRSQWTEMFLQHKGFQYILKVFMDKEIQASTSEGDSHSDFELKHIAFLLKLLRIFIMAAFSTSSESQVYQVADLVRRSSSIQEDETAENEYIQTQVKEGSRFKELQKLLTGPIGEEIISQINYQALQQKILTVISQVLLKKRLIFEDKLIIENALSLWVGCNLHNNDLLNDFYQFSYQNIQSSDDFILTGLLYCEQDKVREEFKQSLSCLSQKLLQTQNLKEVPLYYLLKLLSNKFSIISDYHSKQYFELFCELIDQYFLVKSLSQSSEEQVFNPEQLLALIIDKIKEYNKLASASQETSSPLTKAITNQESIQEDDSSQSQEVSEQENIYIGLIQLTGKIIDNFDISFSEKIVEQKNLIDEIFVQFLFASVFKQDSKEQNEGSLKLKPRRGQRQEIKKQQFGKKSKDAAYKLLNSLIKKSPLLMNAFLEKSMIPLMNLIKKQNGWNYTPPGHSENKQKYVGLKNLGCICYMNSMLQQFFMIPAFRYNLLAVEDTSPEDIQEYKGQRVDDNVLRQLQKLMTSLELSERQDFNPFEFCFAFKDLDGNPTNTGEQKDAQEFLNLSFDRIENFLRGTSRKYLLQSVFGGQTCSQLVCTECRKVKNRIEDYYNLSLTVKDIKSLYDSMQKLIEGEVINDFECDNCKKKVDISKRTLISQTPNVLIVHLQRIIFNFDTFRNDKINSFFDFPYILDLKPYSFYEVMKKEGRLNKAKGEDEEEQQEEQKDEDNQWPEEEDCFEYKLVGVNVHSGTANAGHYWSYINTKRGYLEPDENDANWAKTENDPWMEFNDSTVRDFNFEKLKDECYGGDEKGSDSSWSFGGSYGKSAYMLVYERRKKRPLKILATPEEIETNKEKLSFDPKKDEYYKLVDYRECADDIMPNSIYKQVFEDNQKFEFENDIYSSEFFDFVKGILQAVQTLQKDDNNQGELLASVKDKAMTIGKKTIMDLLAKCFYNTSIRYLVEALIDIMKKDEELCGTFLQQCFNEDNCNYLLEIILECTDSTARLHVGNLLKFVLGKLKIKEADYLYEEIEFDGKKQYRALSSRFIAKCFSILNTQVAKNWSRFEVFLEILLAFAIGEETPKADDTEALALHREQERIGLEFFFKHQFIAKACDFLLGKKSPLSTPNEKRFEMGGSFNSPNFTPIIKLVTRMITDSENLEKYPLSEVEKQMFLHHDLLKVMLGSPGSKQFGHCLANMCRENERMSQKVSKVFIKAINNSNFDNVKSYLKALKPFLKMDDSLKDKKLEWVFGFSQIYQRKTYREERYKYGLEFIDRIGDEAYTYVSPVGKGVQEESLFAQLLKCKGKLDTFAINCLQEMLSLMAKDDRIARFVYATSPNTYQTARYCDWIRPYLEYQKSEVEKANSYAYFKNKHDAILKSLEYLEKFDERCVEFAKEELERYEQASQTEEFKEVAQDWLTYQHPEVIKHFPPQIIIGKQTQEDREFLVYDENPLVKVVVYEITCEYAYSNPTLYFNLSLPHLELKTNNYQTLSYNQYKKSQFETEKRQLQIDQMTSQQQLGNQRLYIFSTTEASDSEKNPQEQALPEVEYQEPEIIVKDWFQNKKEGPMLLKVLVTNKEKKKINVAVTFKGDDATNAFLPSSCFKERFLDADTKCLCHIMKIDPRRDWGKISIVVETTEKQTGNPTAPPSISVGGITLGPGFIGASTFVTCDSCKNLCDVGTEFCERCGESLGNMGSNVMENYFTGGDAGPNQLY